MPRALVDLDVTLQRGPQAPPLPVQIASAVRRSVVSGALRPGDPAPSSRALAGRLGVSRGSVTAAYDQLAVEGYLAARPRSGMVVSPDLVPPRPRPATANRVAARGHRQGRPAAGDPRSAAGGTPVLDLVPGHEDAAPLDDAAWRSSWRRAAAPASRGTWQVDPLGQPELRAAIAHHLRLLRGMAVDPDSVLVTAGAREGLVLLLSVAAARAGRRVRVGVESPGFPGLRRVLARLGVELVPVPVDAEGLRVDALADAREDAPLDLVVVTPNHQFPYGTAMPASRRQALLDWATRSGVVLVEDDYDSEFRHLGPPLPSLWGLGSDEVIHVGTFAAVLTRDIGTGYLLLPPGWVEDVAAARREIGPAVAPITQRALAAYLDDGGLRRRIARARRRLTAAGDAMRAGLTGVPGVVDTGHLVVVERPADQVATLIDGCRAGGLLVGDLADGWSGAQDRAGIVLTYASLDQGTAATAAGTLRRVLVGQARP